MGVDVYCTSSNIKTFVNNLSRKKLLTFGDLSKTQLSRCLSTVDLTALGKEVDLDLFPHIGIGSTLGAGVYVVVGEVARNSAGPGVILSFLIAALSSILSGEIDSTSTKILRTASVARAWSSNFDGLVNNKLSDCFSEHFPMNSTILSNHVDPFAFGITLLVTAVLTLGAQESSFINNLFTLVNLGVISYVAITGCFRVNFANWQVDPASKPLPEGFAVHCLLIPGNAKVKCGRTCFSQSSNLIFLQLTGEEVRNPQRSIPIAIMVCLSICFVAYATVSAVMTLLIPYYTIPVDAALPYAFDQVGWNVARYIIAVGAICALTTRQVFFPV
ncbi:hypothetical protein P879_00613 [Paragonimus westermani]|uniref:Amino acid permease/ SLC12A domain-containing protein n=1 Tax=Paragonimus westermani TaxID=34504 RepID=A0A8T0DS12_9TREM|nr:hypothetical protein P879_00613 [Paragonimus westermani]